MPVKEFQHEMVMSHLRVRRALGWLGFFLPVLLIFGGLIDRLEPTISDFYHTAFRDFYVGTLCAIGIFLIAYKGHPPKGGDAWDTDRINDDRMANVAGIAALVMAFFPNLPTTQGVPPITQAGMMAPASPAIHYIAALFFFATLGLICIKQFARTSDEARARFYRRCGYIIFFALFATLVAVVLRRFIGGGGQQLVEQTKIIFWFEAIGTWAFAAAWLKKGRADEEMAKLISGGRGP